MESVGSKLKLQREELGFSHEEMSQKTKLTVPQIRALEEGDTSFFHDDLSYVPYITRFYAQALHIDYDQLREEVSSALESYQKTQQLKVIQSHEKMEKRIQKKSALVSLGRKKLLPVGKRRIDYSFLSLIMIILILVISLVFVFFAFVLPMIQNNSSSVNPDPIVSLPVNPNTQTPDPVDPTPDEPVASTMTAVFNPSSAPGRPFVDVGGFKESEEVLIEVTFAEDTWIKVYLDDVATNNPQSKIYKPNETMEIRSLASEGHTIMIHFGYMRGNKIRINQTEVVIDDYSANATNGVRVTLTFKGES